MSEKLSKARGYVLAALPYFLIFSEAPTNILIGLLALLSLTGFQVNGSGRINLKEFLISISPYIITIVGLLYTSELNVALKELEIRASLLVFPLVFSLSRSKRSERKLFFSHLIFSLAVAFVAAVAIAFYRNSQDTGIRDGWFIKYYFQYNDFTDPIGIDPLYISFYLSFAFTLLTIELLKPESELTEIKKAWKVVLVTIMLIFLVMVSTRSWMIITFFIALSLLLWTWRRLTLKIRLTVIALFLSIILLAFALPVTRGRFIGIFAKQWEFTDYTLDRFIIWSTAGSFIVDHPSEFIFGHGTGSSDELMSLLYQTNHIDWDFEQKTNTHNQYLNFILNQGFVGLFVLAAYLVLAILHFVRLKSWTGIYFIVLLGLGLMTENYFDRQKGVVFIALVYSLLFFQATSEKETIKEIKNG